MFLEYSESEKLAKYKNSIKGLISVCYRKSVKQYVTIATFS